MNTSEGGLNLLHEADDDALSWLKSAATAALAKEINRCSMGKIVYSNEERLNLRDPVRANSLKRLRSD